MDIIFCDLNGVYLKIVILLTNQGIQVLVLHRAYRETFTKLKFSQAPPQTDEMIREIFPYCEGSRLELKKYPLDDYFLVPYAFGRFYPLNLIG